MMETTAWIKDDKFAMDEHSWMLPRDVSNQEKETTSGTHEHSHEHSHEKEQNEVCIVFEVPLKEEDGPSGSVRRLPKHVDRRRSLSTYSDGFSLDLSEQTPISMLTLDLTPTSVKQIKSKVVLNKELSNTDKDNKGKTRMESTHEHSHEHSYEQMIIEVEAKVEEALQQSKNYKTQRRGKERTNHSHNKNSNRASSRHRNRKVAKDKHHDKAAQMTRNYRSSKRDDRKDTIRKNRIGSSQQDYSRSLESEGKHAMNTQITNGTAHPAVKPKRGGEKRDPPGSRFTFKVNE